MTSERLSDRVGILSLGQGLAVVVQLALGVFLAHAWSRNEFGSYLQLTMVVATLLPILFLGIPSSLYYFLPLHAGEGRDRILVQASLLLLSLGIAGSGVVALLAGPLAGRLNNPELAPAIRLYGLSLVGLLPAAVAHPLLASLRRDRAAGAVVLAQGLGEAAVVAAGALAGLPLPRLAVALAAVHLAVGAAVVGLVAALVTVRRLPRLALGDARPLRELLRYALPFAASMHLGTINRFLDRYLIGSLYAPALFAVYAVGARHVPVVPLLIGSIDIVLQQRFTTLHGRGRTGEILPTWHAAVRRQALLVLPLAVVLFLFAEPFVTGLYSDRYRDSVPIFRVYLALLALRVATWPIVLTAAGRTRTLLAGSVLGLAVNAAASLALVRPLGLLGPAAGAVAGALAAAAYYLVRTRQLLGVSWRAVLPWSTLLAVAASAAASGFLVAPLARLLDAPLPALAGAGAYAAVFAAFARAAGVLRADDVALVRRWLTLGPLRGVGTDP